jgi:hypothetical protein
MAGVASHSVGLSASSFDQTETLAEGGGVQDITLDVMGHVIVIPLSMVNKYLRIMGNIAVACTAVACMRIVFKRGV